MHAHLLRKGEPESTFFVVISASGTWTHPSLSGIP